MDPRIDRTKKHVLESALELLADEGAAYFSFSTIAKHAKVSRATLYRHWQSPAQLLADVILQTHRNPPSQVELPTEPEAFLLYFLRGVNTGMSEPSMKAALAALMSYATSDEKTQKVLYDVGEERRATLESVWGPIDQEEYTRMVGPIVHQIFLARKPVRDEFIQSLVDDAIQRRSQGKG